MPQEDKRSKASETRNGVKAVIEGASTIASTSILQRLGVAADDAIEAHQMMMARDFHNLKILNFQNWDDVSPTH